MKPEASTTCQICASPFTVEWAQAQPPFSFAARAIPDYAKVLPLLPSDRPRNLVFIPAPVCGLVMGPDEEEGDDAR
jgi:hypothetical protein